MNTFEAEGFRFDMGPSWYLMPDVFENFYTLMGEKVEDHLDLVQLQPSYRIFFKEDETLDMYSDLEKDIPTLERLEPGSGEQLKEYLRLSEIQYDIARDEFLYKNYNSIFDFLNWKTMIMGSKLSVFTKMEKYVSRFFKTELSQPADFKFFA